MTNPWPWHGSGEAEHRPLLRHCGHPPEAVLEQTTPAGATARESREWLAMGSLRGQRTEGMQEPKDR